MLRSVELDPNCFTFSFSEQNKTSKNMVQSWNFSGKFQILVPGKVLLLILPEFEKQCFVLKILLTYCEKNIVLAIKTKRLRSNVREFSKFLRSLKQFIQIGCAEQFFNKQFILVTKGSNLDRIVNWM